MYLRRIFLPKESDMAKVKNINGTSDTVCKCGSWLEHWKKFSGQKVNMCIEVKCLKTDLVGAHVQKDDPDDSSWYIIPLCKSHSKGGGELQILGGFAFVPADNE